MMLVMGVVAAGVILPACEAVSRQPLDPQFEEGLILKNYGYACGIAADDVNSDGRLDVVVVLNRAGSVVWFENPGVQAEAAWTRRAIVDEKLPGAYDVAVADFDGDGRLDVAASSWRRGRRFTWYRSPGADGFAAEWPEHLVEGDLAETRTIRVADFNADGRPDLLGTASGGAFVAWYENSRRPSGEVAWRRHSISTLPAPIHGEPVDMDDDGDIDVVMAHGMRDDLAPNEADHRIVWYENPGQPGGASEWPLHEVGPFPWAFEAVAADLDGDGHRDIVATAWGENGRIAWFRNPGASQPAAWTVALLKTDWPNANQVITTDLDGDGRPDIAAEAGTEKGDILLFSAGV